MPTALRALGTVKQHLCLFGDANHVHLRRWADAMLSRGWQVSVVTARPEAQAGVEQIVLPPVGSSRDWLFRVGAARRAVKALQPDLLHAHYITSYGYLAARCRTVTNARPLVLTAWGSDLLVTPFESRLKRWLTGWTLRQAQAITGDSADLVDAARAYRPAAELLELHWGVELQRFRPTPWGDKPGFEIVSLRSWSENYRIETILRAVARLSQARLHLLGGGPDEAGLRALTVELGLGERVVFHGRMDDAGMTAVMARCKVAVTVPASDATSVSLLESMACGLAVVASDLPANRQWLPPDCLVPVDDVDALAQALQALADDDARCQRHASDNAERMRGEGSRDAQMDRADALYQRLLKTS
jgi:glycosyltransferase involved in cell wall biosynthesis